MSTDVRKKKLAEAVMAFPKGNFYENGLKLFKTLGYNASRKMPMDAKKNQHVENDNY